MAIVKYTAEHYLAQLNALLPRGPAWPDQYSASKLHDLLSGWADTLARVSAALASLIDESDPRSTNALLPDWERVAGLPSACVQAFSAEEQTVAERRAALVAHLISVGGQTPAYYLAVVEALGYRDVTLTEYSEFSVDDDVDAEITGPEWAFAWSLSLAGTDVHDLTVEDPVDEALTWWSHTLLECVIDQLKPAHTTVIYNYL